VGVFHEAVSHLGITHGAAPQIDLTTTFGNDLESAWRDYLTEISEPGYNGGAFFNHEYLTSDHNGYNAEDETLVTEWFTYTGVIQDENDNYVEFRQCIEDCSKMDFT
jgi:hypothetical protein